MVWFCFSRLLILEVMGCNFDIGGKGSVLVWLVWMVCRLWFSLFRLCNFVVICIMLVSVSVSFSIDSEIVRGCCSRDMLVLILVWGVVIIMVSVEGVLGRVKIWCVICSVFFEGLSLCLLMKLVFGVFSILLNKDCDLVMVMLFCDNCQNQFDSGMLKCGFEGVGFVISCFLVLIVVLVIRVLVIVLVLVLKWLVMKWLRILVIVRQFVISVMLISIVDRLISFVWIEFGNFIFWFVGYSFCCVGF